MLRIVSPTGKVHAVNQQFDLMPVLERTKLGFATLCNQYYHKWPTTTKDVTCKRCLSILNKMLEHKETGWTRARSCCEHRYPHLKYGIQCKNKCYHGVPDKPRLCDSLYCAIPHASTPASMVAELVHDTITNIGKELVFADKAFVLRFKMIAVHCGWRKPAVKGKFSKTHWCSNPDLKKGGMDHKFGWACNMNNCPHMLEALVWRSDNSGPRK